MKPFRATHQTYNYRGEPEGEPETVLVIAILPPQPQGSHAIAVFVHADSRLDQDEISTLTNCIVPWYEA